MKSRGFTLIELLGVIVILGILGMIGFMSIDKNIKKGAYQTCLTQERAIKEAAKTWVIDNNPSSSTEVYIDTLKTGGYIESDMKSPITNENYSSGTKVIVTVTGNKYTYEITYGEERENCNNQKIE